MSVTYVVTVDVANILLDDTFMMAAGSKRRMGCRHGGVTTRVVTASTMEEAKEMAIGRARAELESGVSIPVTNSSSNPPIYTVTGIRAVDDDEASGIPNAGFTLFPEDREDV